MALAGMPPTASEAVDCRTVSGYRNGPVPDTCTVPLTLDDAQAEIVDSLRAEYEEFPLRCRLGKYRHTLSET